MCSRAEWRRTGHWWQAAQTSETRGTADRASAGSYVPWHRGRCRRERSMDVRRRFCITRRRSATRVLTFLASAVCFPWQSTEAADQWRVMSNAPSHPYRHPTEACAAVAHLSAQRFRMPWPGPASRSQLIIVNSSSPWKHHAMSGQLVRPLRRIVLFRDMQAVILEGFLHAGAIYCAVAVLTDCPDITRHDGEGSAPFIAGYTSQIFVAFPASSKHPSAINQEEYYCSFRPPTYTHTMSLCTGK